jgi:hypothetical protein
MLNAAGGVVFGHVFVTRGIAAAMLTLFELMHSTTI